MPISWPINSSTEIKIVFCEDIFKYKKAFTHNFSNLIIITAKSDYGYIMILNVQICPIMANTMILKRV